ncbi:MAG: ATP-binding cassette domain-containing protein [Desulfovibrio sp.]|jgi:ABC-type multidrug transport system fused ATPase/permease subunit|nr:ATP-binding cassette domain-containing protein [Desulfovibrio sp.]
MLRNFFEKFLADFARVYKVLPQWLRRSTRRVFACVALLAVLEIGTILSISFLTVSIAAPEKLREFGAVARLLQTVPWLDALCEDPRRFALLVASAVVALTAAKNAMTAWVSLGTARLGEHIALFAGETVFRNYLYSPYIAHLAGDSQAMFQALSWRGQLGRMVVSLMTVYTYAAITLGMAVTLLSVTPGAILLVVLAVALTAAALYKSLKGRLDRAGADVAEHERGETRATMNAMHGIRETLIYRQQEVFFESFRAACLNGMKGRAFLLMAPPIPTWTLETVGFLVIPVTLWAMYALQDASMARITGVLTMIMLVSWRVLPMLNRSLSALVSVRGMRHAALDCLARVEAALAEPAPAPPEPDPGFTLSRDIAFAGVCFRYPRAEADCLRDLTFTIPRGSRLGIIGQSGAGKSSVAAILSGLVEPTSGAVLVDGAPLSPAGLAAYCPRVGYVPQTPYILAGTLAENVAFSSWGRPWDGERVKAVCRMAELDMAERRGIETAVGANGVGLSGGQAQRLSIARALYAGPSVLILDEATSALDTGVEAAIMNTIFALPQSITTIIIAHRLSTVERCDTLLWIEGGRLAASGPPDAVLPEYRAFLDNRAASGPCAQGDVKSP